MVKKKVVIFPVSVEDTELTRKICQKLGVPMGNIKRTVFKNGVGQPGLGESARGKYVVLVQTTYPDPMKKFADLCWAIRAAKEAHATNFLVVIPYTPFARSDKKDQPHIPIGIKLFANLTKTAGADAYLLCDMHNDASVASFDNWDSITARKLLFTYFETLPIDVVIAVDVGDTKRAKKVAINLGVPWGIADKTRIGNDDSAQSGEMHVTNVSGKSVLIVDDEIGTFSSMAGAIRLLDELDVGDIYLACSHAVLCGEAIELMKQTKFKELVTTDTVYHSADELNFGKKVTTLTMSDVFADAITCIIDGKSMGKLYDWGNA